MLGLLLLSPPSFADLEELDSLLRPAGLPEDPYLTYPSLFENFAAIHLFDAWEVTSECAGTVIAVIDTGVDLNHPDLQDNLWRNEKEIPDNGVDDDGNFYVDDERGYDFFDDNADPWDVHDHGTRVAGIIGAVANNRIGLSGVCQTARLMPLKVVGPDGTGRLSMAIEAIDYAVAQGARVLNLSWTIEGEEEPVFLKEALQRAGAQGAFVAAAAGNEGRDLASSPVYPAAYELPHMISVGASDSEGLLAEFSNFGGNIALEAPGVSVMTTGEGGDYKYFSGTSASASHVAGVAALLLSRDPSLTPERVSEILVQSAGSSGILNASAALALSQPEPDLVPAWDMGEDHGGGGCSLLGRGIYFLFK